MKRTIIVLGGVLGIAVLGGMAAATVSHAARKEAPKRADTVTIRGRLQAVVHDRFDQEESSVTYTILEQAGEGKPARALTLELPESEGAPIGRLIEMSGTLAGDTLIAQGDWTVLDAEVSPEWRRHARRIEESHAANVREYQMLVMLVNLVDLNQPCSVNDVNDTVFGAQDESVVNYYWEQSFHQFDLQGQVVGPYTISSSGSHCQAGTWQHKADDLAALDPAVIAAGGLASYDTRFYIFPAIPGTSCTGGAGEISGDEAVSFGHCGDHVFAHEMGHNLGMHHAAITGNAYGDLSDTMGGSTGDGLLRHFNAPHKVQMEWIPNGPAPAEDRLVDVTQSGLYTISRLELEVAGTNQVLKFDSLVSGPDAYWVSYRTAYGPFGANLSSAYQPKMNVHTGRGLEFYTRFLGSDVNNTTAFADGQTFSDPDNNVCITLVSHTDALAHVWVSFDCTEEAPPACPSVSGCNGFSCIRGAETGDFDLGYGRCVTDAGVLLNCGSQTVHQVSTNCNLAACCFQQPFPCVCPNTCPGGQYLECR